MSQLQLSVPPGEAVLQTVGPDPLGSRDQFSRKGRRDGDTEKTIEQN